MSPKTRRRALAVPFVLCLAAAPACVVHDEGAHPNPPPPQPTTTQPTGTAPVGIGPGPATTTPPATTPATGRPLVAATPPLVKIRKAPDGTCWQDDDTKCPPEPATCNPPPPRKVDCVK